MNWSGSDRLEYCTVAQSGGGRSSLGRGRPERHRRALRLVVESLKDRTVLTTMLMVSSLLDSGGGQTLRAAIDQANDGPDSEYVRLGFAGFIVAAVAALQVYRWLIWG
ncbi:hypothetical protein SAMN05444166_6445 [Singulisphaera sp. GP187]|uniref:hypothetical protein n=1 Tax=Singulisphaera sp. GP187 TaxID=1882752 RepID=UPI00092870B3|nr:hypothetical protein [Singulisphaera sp. GP187]SIO60573.1 hypothetical protein SAMN05444166_6445 [Singulisphaera sp. GP187]